VLFLPCQQVENVWDELYKKPDASVPAAVAKHSQSLDLEAMMFDDLKQGVRRGDELATYLAEACLDGNHDVLNAWRLLEDRFPSLARMAKDYLAVPGATVGVERVFSGSGRIVVPHRNRLKPATIEKLMLLRNWMIELPRPESLKP
jgi:hypothetical protein